MKHVLGLVGSLFILSACSLTQGPKGEQGQVELEPQAVVGNRVVADGGGTQFNALAGGLSYLAVESGHLSSFVLQSDGQILAKGDDSYCQQQVPALPTGLRYTDVSAYFQSMLALRSDGQVVGWGGWGNNFSCPAQFLPKDSRFMAVAAGMTHGLALRNDGTIRAWGTNVSGELEVPPLPAGLRYTEIGADSHVSLALRSDGQIIVWGDDTNSLSSIPALPQGLTYTTFSAFGHALALRSDGQVIGWGRDNEGQLEVPPLPSGLRYTAVSAGYLYSLALRSDNRILDWGVGPELNSDPAFPPLPLGSTYVAIAAGPYNASALVIDAPKPESLYKYKIDFESFINGSVVSSVALGRGVITIPSRLRGSTMPIQVSGQTSSASVNQARVFGTQNKLLSVSTDGKIPSKTGGSLGVSFVPSFTSVGVTVTSLKLFATSQTTLTIYHVDGKSRRVLIPTPVVDTPSSRTIQVNSTGVKAISVSSRAAFAIDDIEFVKQD